MKLVEFESLMFVDVAERASAEPAAPSGEPRYQRRPWTQLRDEMLASGAKTVDELSAKRIALFYRSTRSADGGVKSLFRSVFGASPG